MQPQTSVRSFKILPTQEFDSAHAILANLCIDLLNSANQDKNLQMNIVITNCLLPSFQLFQHYHCLFEFCFFYSPLTSSGFSLLKDFKSKIFSSKVFILLFKSFKEAKHFATTTATHKTNKSTFTTKYERCLLVLDSFSFFSIVLAVKCRKMFLAIFPQSFARSHKCKMTRKQYVSLTYCS